MGQKARPAAAMTASGECPSSRSRHGKRHHPRDGTKASPGCSRFVAQSSREPSLFKTAARGGPSVLAPIRRAGAKPRTLGEQTRSRHKVYLQADTVRILKQYGVVSGRPGIFGRAANDSGTHFPENGGAFVPRLHASGRAGRDGGGRPAAARNARPPTQGRKGECRSQSGRRRNRRTCRRQTPPSSRTLARADDRTLGQPQSGLP